MKKRAALARAMAVDPEVLFCDEPSAGLDPITAADLDRLLLGLRDRFGMAMVVVTHELASVQAIADRVTMLDHGKVLVDGTLDEARRTRPSLGPIVLRSGRQSADAAGGCRCSTRCTLGGALMNLTRSEKIRLGAFVLVGPRYCSWAACSCSRGSRSGSAAIAYWVSFSESVSGLEPSAQVKYRGLRVGRVESLKYRSR